MRAQTLDEVFESVTDHSPLVPLPSEGRGKNASVAWALLFELTKRGKRNWVGLRVFVFGSLLLLCSPAGAQTAVQANEGDKAKLEASPGVRAEQIRAACIQGRRCVCGRVLKVFPNGVLVDSGYPDLLRDSLHGAWHLPGTVAASRPTNLVESLESDSICVGTVFLTDLPKLKGAKIQQYDYVVLHSFPAGEFAYKSVGDIRRTVRRFSGGLETAVRLVIESEQRNAASRKQAH